MISKTNTAFNLNSENFV